MKTVNKAILIGYVGKDPEIRYTQAGTAVANFSLATNERWKDKQTGETKERTDWHQVAAWAKLAEIVGEYVKKGMPVYVEGVIRTETYEKDGQTHYRTKIQAETIHFLGERAEAAQKSEKVPEKAEKVPETAPKQPDFDDDIPF